MPSLPPITSSKSSPRGAVIEPEENYSQWDREILRRPALQGYRQRIDLKPSYTEHEAPMNTQQLRAVQKPEAELNRDQERHVQVKAQRTAGLIADPERSRRSISERRAAWVPPLEGDSAASESFVLRQRRRTSMLSISSATAIVLPENDDEMREGGLELGRRQVDTLRKAPWTALMRVGEKDSDISRTDGRSYSAPDGRDENPVSASRVRIPIPSLTSLKEGLEMIGQAVERLYDCPSDKSPSYPRVANTDHRSSQPPQSRSAKYDNARNLPHLSTRAQSISQELSHAKNDNEFPSSSGPQCVGPKFFFASDELLEDQDSIPQQDPSPPWDSADLGLSVFSSNHYKDSRKDGERERQASSMSSSRLSAKYKSPSSATRAGSRNYLRNDSFEDREGLDRYRNSDVKPDRPPNHARRSSYSKSGRDDSERHRNDIDYSARIEKANGEELGTWERVNPVVSGLASRQGSDTQITSTRDRRAEHLHSFRRDVAHTTVYERPPLPETWATPELADSSLEDAFKRLRQPTPERSSIVAKKDRSLSRTTDHVHERSQCSICELYTSRSPPASGARKPSISPAGGSTVSKHFVLAQQGSPTSVRSITTASGTQLLEVDSDHEMPEGFIPRGRPVVRTKGSLASSEKAKEKGSGTRHSGGRWYSISHGGDERHASPVPASLRITPIPSLAPPLTARAQRTVPDFSHAGDDRHHSSSPPVTQHIGRQSSFAQDGRSDYHDFIPRQHLSPPHSADSGRKGLTHSSNNSYQESHKDRKLMRHYYSSQSPSDSSRYHTPPSLVPKTKSGEYLQDVNSIDRRERLDHVMKSDVKSDHWHRWDRARRSSYSRTDASEKDSYDDCSAHVSSGLSTTRPRSVRRRRVTSPPVGEVSSWKDWEGVPEGRCGYESTFRTPLLPPGAGATAPHSAGSLPRRGDTSHSAPESARYHDHPGAYDRLDHNDGLEEEYIEEPGLSGENSVAHGPVRLPFWAVGLWEEDWRRQEEKDRKSVV